MLALTIFNPNMSPGDLKSYQPIFLLCTPSRSSSVLSTPVSSPPSTHLLPLLIQDIKNFLVKKKAGTVFFDLTAAYDTMWYCGITCKLLCLLPDRHMVKMIMELVTNCSFTFTAESRTCSRLRCLKNSVPLGSVLDLLYNIYAYDLLTSVSQKYAYTDDLAFMHSAGDWQAVEGALSQDLVTLAAYLNLAVEAQFVKNGVDCLPSEQQGGKS